MRAVFGVACAGALAACTLLNSLDGYDEPYPPDGGGGTDAPLDSVAEASVDAGDAGALAFCQTQDATFCDDFERTDLKGDWSGFNLENDIHIDAGVLVTHIASTAKAETGAKLRRTLGTGDHIVYEYDLVLLELPDSGSLQINNLYVLYAGTERAFVCLLADSFGFKAAEQIFPNGNAGTFTPHEFKRVPQLGQKTHVRFELSLSTTSSSVIISFDGDTVYSGTLNAFFRPGTFEVNAGVDYAAGKTSGLEFTVDNVVVHGP